MYFVIMARAPVLHSSIRALPAVINQSINQFYFRQQGPYMRSVITVTQAINVIKTDHVQNVAGSRDDTNTTDIS